MAQATYYPSAGFKTPALANEDLWYDGIPGDLAEWTDETALTAPELAQLAVDDTNGPSAAAAYDADPPTTGWRPGGILFRWSVGAVGTLTQLDFTIKGYANAAQGAKFYMWDFAAGPAAFVLQETHSPGAGAAFSFTPSITSGEEGYRDGSNYAWGLLCTTEAVDQAIQLRLAKLVATYTPAAGGVECPLMLGANF